MIAAPQFIFQAVGSHGDVLPLLVVAAELVRRGHRCQLLANEHFRAHASSLGVGFEAISDRRTNFTGPEGYEVDKYLFPAFARTREYFRRPGSHDRNTVVVNHDRWAASDPLAQARSLRSVRFHLSPFKIRSLLAPAWPLGANVGGLLGETYRRYALPAVYRGFDTDPKILERVNRIRTGEGLSQVNSASHDQPHIVAEVALFPDWYAPPAEDWPPLQQLGFPLPRTRGQLPRQVLEFLDRYSQPLVFTPGTSVSKVDQFLEGAAACCTELDRPGIILSPFLNTTARPLTPRLLHVAHVELDLLLERCSLIVHHGGVGTTARALQAGIPQLIVPSVFDQPDNGRRVERLGVGRVVGHERSGGATLAAAARALFADPSLPAQLSLCRARVAEQRSIDDCAEILEAVAARSPRFVQRRPLQPTRELRPPEEAEQARCGAAIDGAGKKPHQGHVLLDTIYRETAADLEFSRLLDHLLQAVRQFMSVPREVEDPVVEAEFLRLRAQLEAFRAEFRRCHAELVRAELPRESWTRVVRALRSHRGHRVAEQLARIQAGTGRLLDGMRQRMTAIPLYGISGDAS
jgi:rhamnosyltransferase subunit B